MKEHFEAKHLPEFTEFTIENKQTIRGESVGKSQAFNLILAQHLHSHLPYFGFDWWSNGASRGILREGCTRVTFRGDNRSISEIKEAGGFHPKCTLSSEEYPKQPLDITAHRNGLTSGFLSTTSVPRVAYGWGASHALLSNNYTVYALQTKGAITPSFESENPNISREMEYSIPGGVDYENIISYRKCKVQFKRLEQFTTCSNIFFNKKFMEKNPKLVNAIVQEQLFDEEICKPI